MARELSALGEKPRIEPGGVSWEGDTRSMMRANLWLRTASRVLVRVARFRATAFYELEAQAKRISWSRFLADGVHPEFRVTARKSRLYHGDAIAQRLDKAARKASAHEPARRPVRNPKAAKAAREQQPQLFVVRAVRDEFEISADTSGELLHMRGYRQALGKAPLRETLAAALILDAEWNGDVPLIDPFCGSGTLPIEAALLARGMAPGRHRDFAFSAWPEHDESAWRALRASAKSAIKTSAGVRILGSDRDRGAIEAATANAERAGVASDVELSVRPLSAIEPPDGHGLVVTNPPYGVRLSRGTDVRNLYAQLGKILRERCPGWAVGMYATDSRMVGQSGLPLAESFRTSNGGIKVSAYRGRVENASSSARFLH